MQQQQHLDNQLSQFSKNKKILKKIQKQTEITQTKIKRNHQATAIKKQGEKLSQWLYHIAHALPQNASLISLQYDQKTLEIIGVVSTDMDLEAYQKILSALPGISNTYVNEIKTAQEKKGLEFSITLRLGL